MASTTLASLKDCLSALLVAVDMAEADSASTDKKIQVFVQFYQPRLMLFKGMSDLSTSAYCQALEVARREKRPIHLSKKREPIPFSAEIGPKGQLVLNTPRSELLDLIGKKKIKLGYDVLNQMQVVRSIEVEGLKTTWHRKNEEAAMQDFKRSAWMLDEIVYLTYEQKGAVKHVTVREAMEMDLFKAIHQGLHTSIKIEFIHQFLTQLSQIHEKGIHRDIKTENILVNLSTKTLKIFDFEYYTRLDDLEQRKKSLSGTAFITPPEAAQKWLNRYENYEDVHTPPYDMWAAGLVILEIWYDLKKLPPWDGYPSKPKQNLVRLFSRISSTTCSWVPKSEKPIDMLISCLLKPNPTQRWSAKQACEYFKANILQVDRKSVDGGSSTSKSDGAKSADWE